MTSLVINGTARNRRVTFERLDSMSRQASAARVTLIRNLGEYSVTWPGSHCPTMVHAGPIKMGRFPLEEARDKLRALRHACQIGFDPLSKGWSSYGMRLRQACAKLGISRQRMLGGQSSWRRRYYDDPLSVAFEFAVALKDKEQP